MRFAIAAGILSQTLPVNSKSRVSGVGDHAESRRKTQELLLHAQSSGHGVIGIEHADTSNGVYKGVFAKFAKEHGSGAMVNPVDEKIECDPNSEDVDVGILSCGEGKYCMESETSDLGGLCMNEHNDRDLQVGLGFYGSYFCNTTSPYYQYYDCDCSGWNLMTNTGAIACSLDGLCIDYYNTTCANVYSVALYYGPFNHTEYTCYDFYKPYDQQVCYAYAFGNYYGVPIGIPLGASINGVECNSVAPSSYDVDFLGLNLTIPCTEFDCSNTCGMHTGDTCGFGQFLAPILLPNVTGTCNPGTAPPDTPDPTEDMSDPPTMAPVDMTTDAPVDMTTGAPVDMTTSAPVMPTPAPVEMTTEAPVEMPPPPTPAPVGGEPPATDPPVAATESPTEAPTDGGMALLTQKTAVSLFGLSMGLLAYFAA